MYWVINTFSLRTKLGGEGPRWTLSLNLEPGRTRFVTYERLSLVALTNLQLQNTVSALVVFG